MKINRPISKKGTILFIFTRFSESIHRCIHAQIGANNDFYILSFARLRPLSVKILLQKSTYNCVSYDQRCLECLFPRMEIPPQLPSKEELNDLREDKTNFP